MSGDASISGRIRIEPAITWSELADKQHLISGDWKPEPPYHADAIVKVDHQDVNTDQGVLSVRLGVAIVPEGGETNGYMLTQSVQAIVDAFATAPDGAARTFTGFLHLIWAGGEEVYRVHVVEGRAVESKPTLTWPVGARDEDGV